MLVVWKTRGEMRLNIYNNRWDSEEILEDADVKDSSTLKKVYEIEPMANLELLEGEILVV